MADKKDLQQTEGLPYKEKIEKEVANVPTGELLKSALTEIQPKIGVDPFDFLANMIEGMENMNPEKKARKKIFMTESTRKKDRQDFLKKLKMWADILSLDQDLYGMVENTEKSLQETKDLLAKNLGNTVNEVKDLERSYRTVYHF